MADIFICYRRDDSEGHTGRLHDALAGRFGESSVFIDVDHLHPGVDFEQVIQRTLLRSKVVLVVIGRRWLAPRLTSESDLVRKEVEAALAANKRLIPVLVGGAKMPAREKLPPELSALAGKNAITLNHSTWKADVTRLIGSLETILSRGKRSAKPRPPVPASPGTTRATAADTTPPEVGRSESGTGLARRHVLRRRFWQQLLEVAKRNGLHLHAGRLRASTTG